MDLAKSEQGTLNVLLIPLVMALIFFFGALGFGVWAFAERNNYKHNTDRIVDKEVAVAVERTKTEKDNEFLEREKNPLREYKGPTTLGSFSMKYPKTWSAYSSDENGGGASIIFHPLVIPANDQAAYALRVEVIDGNYDQEAGRYDSDAKNGKVRVYPYRLPKLPEVLGVRIDGELNDGKRGSVVLLPLRDKTLMISTESETYLKDFESIILANFSFQP